MERQPDHRCLLLNKLYNIKNEDQIVHRLLRPGWLGKGDVETVLLRTSSGAETVVIRDNDTDHIKIKLQNLNEKGIMDDNHRICWTKFEDADNFFLCVLISPTQIRVWDSSSIFAGGEGMLVHIPCEATSIFPLQLGIIIQRRISVEDQEYDEEEDLIFLSKERSQRTLLPSLYSLSHPLKNFLPIANSNVSESLVFVGNLDKMPIAMTYNIDTMQYAAWKIDPAASEIPFETTWEIDTVAPFLVHDIAITEEGFSSQTSITYNPSSTDALGLGRKKAGVDMLATLNMIQNDYSLMLLQEAMHCPSERPKLSNQIFAAGNAIYVCTGNELLIWRLIDGRFFVSATIPCSHALKIDLMPDSSSQFEPDIILLDHSLKLYRGENFVADVQLENMESITSIHDPVENRLTLVSRTGECCRVELDIILTPLIERVLSALHASLGDVVPLRLRLECARLRLSETFSASDNPAWSVLSLILRQLLHNEEKRSSKNNDSCWNQLLNSSYPSSYEESFPCLDENVPPEELVNKNFASESPNNHPVDFENGSESAASKVKDALFSLHQEFLLSLSTEPWCSLIERLCGDERLDSYVDKSIIHRPLDILYGEAQSRMSSSTPCIRSWITKCLAGHVDEYHFWPSTDRFSSVYPRLYLVKNVFSSMACQIRSNQPFDQSFDLDVVSCLLEAGITDQNFVIEDFTLGMALPIMEALLRCADRPNCEELSQLCTQAKKLIGREDIVDPDLASNACNREPDEYKDNTHGDEDGLVEIESSHALRFRVDNRLKEVGRLLRSSKPVYLKVSRAVEVSDHEYERLKQERLLILIRRVLALPLGRGMFTLGTLDYVPAENLPIPDLCLSGRVPPTNNIIALDTSQCPTDMTMWPSFHNGVAAGLRLPAAVEDASLKITRSWIIYNKTSSYGSEPRDEESSAIHAHGGVLMALGLRGHLSALSMTDVYEYLTQGSVTISVGMLLGMAANKRGTCDPSVSKMLCLHIPSLLPISFSSIDVSSPAHAAAVTGIGLLYQGSSHRLMTEFLLNEMGKRPLLDSSTVDREAYTLSCGLALGMITLGKGESGGSSGITDLEIEERLTRFIFGGVDNRANRRRQDLTDRKMNANGGTVSESERCSRIYEGEGINNDVTAPGALLALGLMYMKSGNKVIAASVAIPNTHFLLEYSRPDTLILRVLARSLILWNGVEPTSQWIEEQIPSVVKVAYDKLQEMANRRNDVDRANVADIAQESNGEGESNQPKNSIQMNSDSLRYHSTATMPFFEANVDIDRQSVRQIHAYILAGSCFSMGLRFAGTANESAARTITKVILDMKWLRDSSEPASLALSPEKAIVGMCLGLCAISLAFVMAGTGDLDAFRLFRSIRWRSDEGIRHGEHIAVSAAIGLLFLGAGQCTLGRTNEDIAALVAAFFPRFPMDANDNKYHLQPLRHLYVLASRQRVVKTIDVESGNSISVHFLKTHFDNQNSEQLCFDTPYLLKNSEWKVSKLTIIDEKYFRRSVIVKNDNIGGVNVLLKKRYDGTHEIDISGVFKEWDEFRHSRVLNSGVESHNHNDVTCLCCENTRSFCIDRTFGCGSKATSPARQVILGILGSITSENRFRSVWDAAMLQAYYKVSGASSLKTYLIHPTISALLVELATLVLKKDWKDEENV